MSGYTHLPMPDMDQWSHEQVLAVYDLCQIISATLMQRYEGQLLERMIESEQRHFAATEQAEYNLSLPLDEPF